ncbi:MAG TPA: MFS transporter [bacterium]|nr:MFS transporter [bacterium]
MLGDLMADPVHDAPADDPPASMTLTPVGGAVTSSMNPRAGGAVRDPRLVLRLNNTIQLLSNGAWYVAIPFFPLYLVSQGASAGVVGTVVGLAGIVPLAISIHAGALVDERGPVVVYAASVALFGAGGVILMAVRGIPAAGVGYGLMTIANIGFAVAAQAIVASASTDESRVRNYGYYSLWNSAGAVIGPIAGGFIAARFGYSGAFSALWILMLPCLAVVTGLRGVPAPSRRAVPLAAAHTLVGTILRQPGIGAILFVSAMMVCAQQLQNTFYPLYLHQIGMAAPLIGMIVAAVSLATMAVRSLLSAGVALLGTGRALLISMIVAAVSFVLAPLTHLFGALIGVSILMGSSVGFTQPLTMSLLVECVTAEFWGVALGIRQSVQRVATIISPLIFGAVSTARSVEPAFFAGAIIFLGAAGIMTRFADAMGRPRDA